MKIKFNKLRWKRIDALDIKEFNLNNQVKVDGSLQVIYIIWDQVEQGVEFKYRRKPRTAT